jgi:ABC-type multidrug transport system fused ATPase/permease subunit
MKKHSVDIQFALLILVIILMNLFMSCSITRKVNKERQEITTEKATDETIKTVSDIITQSGEQIASTTKIIENCDTMVTVQILPTGDQRLDEFLKNNPLRIPVKFNRVTQKQEYTNRQETKKENTAVDTKKKTEEKAKVSIEKKNVDQKTTPSIVFWGIGLLAFAGIAFVGYKFLKNRFL